MANVCVRSEVNHRVSGECLKFALYCSISELERLKGDLGEKSSSNLYAC